MSEPPPPISTTSATPPCDRQDAVAIVQRLRDAGHVAYFAGGCVRDLLLGLNPKDYDVATSAPPQTVRTLFPQTQAVGQAFGVILVRHRGSTVEVATFRSDGAYMDGRRPQSVVFTTAQEDAKRRDFTINGLFLDPMDQTVIDYVGGQADLAGHVIRAIGQADLRFAEDHLRLLRAIRFAARLGFDIEPDTGVAIRRHARELMRISPERVGQEMRIMLTAPTRARAWRLLGECVLRPIVMRFLHAPSENVRHNSGGAPERTPIAQNSAPAAISFFERIMPGRDIPFGLALAAVTVEYLLNTAGSTGIDARSLFERSSVQHSVTAMRQALKISNEESDEMRDTLIGLAPLLSDEAPTLATLKRFLARPTAALSRALLDAMKGAALDKAKVHALQARLASAAEGDVAPTPWVSGDDLTAAGMAPGPLFKRVLDAVYDAQLEDRVNNREEAMDMARRVAGGER